MGTKELFKEIMRLSVEQRMQIIEKPSNPFAKAILKKVC